MLAIILCAVLAVAVMAPETALGKAIRELLLDAPVRKLSTFRRSHWIAAVGALGLIAGIIAYAHASVWLLAQGLPEALSWFAMFDVATYMDAVGLFLLVAVTVRLRDTVSAIRSMAKASQRLILRLVRRMDAGRSRHIARRARPKRSKPSDGSEEGDRAWPSSVSCFA